MRPSVSRPRRLRRMASVSTALFAWTTLLSLPAQALAHPPPTPKREGVRTLTTGEMQKIVGRQSSYGGGHTVPATPDGGATYPWEVSVGDVNTGNGNKITKIPIVGWVQRGGLPVDFTLAHNSEGVHNSELGQKWTHSVDIYLVWGTSGTDDPILKVHWGDDLSYGFLQNVDNSFSPPTGIHDTLVENSDSTYTLTRPDQTVYHFKTNLYCDSISDENGNSIALSYNSGNYVTTIVDATSRTISLSYDTSNRISTVTDPLSRVWTMSYDSSNNLTGISLPTLGGSSYGYTIGYNSSHDITSLETPAGRYQTFSYNSDNSIAWERDGVSNETDFSYTSTTTTITDPNSHSTVYTYSSGLLTEVTDALSDSESYGYDSANNRTSVTSKRGYTSHYTFDASGNVLTVEDPYSNYTETNTYNSHNRLLTSTDSLGNETLNTFDTHDNLTQSERKNAAGTVLLCTTLTYDTHGLLQTSVDNLSHGDSFYYDGDGNCTSAEDANGHYSYADYNDIGWKTSATDALSHTVSYTIDNWGRVTAVTTPSGTTTTGYDLDGNATSVEDANSHTTSMTYDNAERLLTVTKPNSDEVSYSYDGTGQKGLLSSKTDGNSHALSFTYTARNQKASESYADSTSESWTYDADGEMSTHVDQNGHTISYAYDHRDLLTGISYPAGTGVSISYDTQGRRTGMTDASGTTGYTLDGAERVTQLSEPNGTVSYTFDTGGRRTAVALSGTGTWSYGFDSGNRLTSVENPSSETASFSYDAANRLTSQTNGDSSVTSYSYDSSNRTTEVLHQTSASVTLAEYDYTYDAAGNVSTRTDTDGTVTTFGYDAADQITSESRDNSHGTGYSVAYTYDHNANRLTKTVGTSTDTYSYDSHDHLQSAGNKSYGYDSNGNCTSVTVGSGMSAATTTLTYDYENRVTGITYPSSAVNSFSYNGEDLRVGKTDSTGTFANVTDGTAVASPILTDGAATYTPGLSEHRGTASKFYHSDALGSTRGITNSSQSVTDSTLYDAFGMTVSHSGSTPTPFGFVGGSQYQTDNDSGLMLLGHRYYDASIGRFISSDPAKAGDNWYAYCNNNPLNRSDPTGQDGLSIGIGVVVGVAVTVATGGNLYLGMLAGFATTTAISHYGEHQSWGSSAGDGAAAALLVPEAAAIAYAILPGLDAIGFSGASAAAGAAGATTAAGNNCFVAGTPVQMADGTTKAIEEIKKGDVVLSRDQNEAKDQKRTLCNSRQSRFSIPVGKRVVRTFVHKDARTLELRFTNGEHVMTTPGHPFCVEGKGFVLAGQLAIGNAIVTRAGPVVRVIAIEHPKQRKTVYNFEVEQAHTYFVGEIDGGMWVHNDSFVVDPNGNVIPIPSGASGPVPVINNGGQQTGIAYVGGSGGSGFSAKTTDVRIMDPTTPKGSSPGYPGGYVTYENGSGQGVNPYTGQTIPNNDPWRHMPR